MTAAAKRAPREVHANDDASNVDDGAARRLCLLKLTSRGHLPGRRLDPGSFRLLVYATQRSVIERAADARGDEIEAWYAEKRSAKTMDRAELQRVLAAARADELQGVRLYLFRLDRSTRTGIADILDDPTTDPPSLRQLRVVRSRPG